MEVEVKERQSMIKIYEVRRRKRERLSGKNEGQSRVLEIETFFLDDQNRRNGLLFDVVDMYQMCDRDFLLAVGNSSRISFPRSHFLTKLALCESHAYCLKYLIARKYIKENFEKWRREYHFIKK